jgi:hypothetical protein
MVSERRYLSMGVGDENEANRVCDAERDEKNEVKTMRGVHRVCSNITFARNFGDGIGRSQKSGMSQDDLIGIWKAVKV